MIITPSLLDYFLIFVSCVLTTNVGRYWIKSDFFSALLLGLLICGGIVSVSARFCPIYTSEIICYLHLLFLAISIYNKDWNICFKLKKPDFVILFLLFLYYFSAFHYENYAFNDHDTVYFSSTLEAFNANYFGNLKVFVSYPNELASNHILPGMALGVMCYLVPKFSLIHLIELKYVLLCLYSSWLVSNLYHLLNVKRNEIVQFFLVTYSIFFIFGIENSYNFLVSNFIAVITITKIFFLFLQYEKDIENKAHAVQILIFSILLISTKAPIINLFGVFLVFIAYYLKVQKMPLSMFLKLTPFLIITALNVFSWIVIPKPNTLDSSLPGIHLDFYPGNIAYSAGLFSGWIPEDCVVLQLKQLIKEAAMLMGNHFDKNVIEKFKFLFANGISKDKLITLFSALLTFSVFIPLMIFKNTFCLKKISAQYKVSKIFLWFGILSFLSLMFFRNYGIIAHQMHIIYIFSGIAISASILYCIPNKNSLVILLPYVITLHILQNQDFLKTPTPPRNLNDLNTFIFFKDLDKTLPLIWQKHIISLATLERYPSEKNNFKEEIVKFGHIKEWISVSTSNEK